MHYLDATIPSEAIKIDYHKCLLSISMLIEQELLFLPVFKGKYFNIWKTVISNSLEALVVHLKGEVFSLS